MKRIKGFELGSEALEIDLPDDTVVFERPPKEQLAVAQTNPTNGLAEALEHPIGMPRIQDLVDKRSRVAITLNDWMGGSYYAAPAVLEILARAGVPDSNIRMMVAGGTHAKITNRELAGSRLARWITGNKPPFPESCRILPPDLVTKWAGSFRLELHDSSDPAQLVNLGVSKCGDLVEVNKILTDSDIVIHLGWGPLPLSPFGGFLGTGLAIGLSSARSILSRHSPGMLTHPDGVHAHPVHQVYQKHKMSVMEKIEESISAKIFYVDPFINIDVQLAYGWWAGEWRQLRHKQVEIASREFITPLPRGCDVLILGCPGYMLHGQTSNPMLALTHVANTMRGFMPPNPVLRKGGVVILTTPGDGIFDERYRPSDREVVGHYAHVGRDMDELFDQYAEEYLTREDLLYKYRHCYGFHPIHPFWTLASCEYVFKHASKVIFAGAKESVMSKQLGITVTPDLNTAWEMAKAETGGHPDVTALPNSSRRLYVFFDVAKA